MEDQQKFNQLLNEIYVYKQQGDLNQQQIELVRASIAEVDALCNTLDDLEGKDSVEAFVPVGAGSFIKGELKNTDEVIVSIGSGIAVKKDVDGARETIARQKKELEDQKKELEELLTQLEPFLSLDFDISRFLQFRYMTCRFGRISREYYNKF